MKIKLGVIFGGMSTEHEVSIKSAESILNNLNKEKYEIYQIYINKEGIWYDYINNMEIENIVKYLKNLDVVFPVLHGLYGEDGTIQGLLELLKIPYVGCKVLASSVGMDKVYSKVIFEKAKINQAKYVYIKKFKEKENYIYVEDNFKESVVNLKKLVDIIKFNLEYPMFVKPSNSGSSVGVNKATNDNELTQNIKIAEKFDNKILIEQAIFGREIECSVVGNPDIGIDASTPGEILSAEDFYSYDAKYNMEESKTIIPANLHPVQVKKLQELAKKAFCAIDGNGLARVDFFIEDETQKIYINEINTMPGFTDISMYPKLFENDGLNLGDLLDKLIKISTDEKNLKI